MNFHLRQLVAVTSFVLSVAIGTSARAASGGGTSVDWPSYNNDVASDRYAETSVITPANVSGLHVVCSLKLGGPINFQTAPIVVAGILYTTRGNQTFALNAATCAPVWTNTYAKGSASQQTRGLAYAAGQLFRGYADGTVAAISTSTGATTWQTSAIATGSFEKIYAAPIAWNGEVLLGTDDVDEAQVCHVFALDAATGKMLWSKQTVPNESDSAASSWKGSTHIAGGSMWSSFTVDPATGSLFVPIGNPEPDYDTRQRLGLNLYTNSVLQLASTNGALQHGFQFESQDDHDWDQAATPAIVTLGNGTKIALVAGKDGYLRALDLATFKQSWKTAVTTISNASAAITTSGTHYCPSGGTLWNGAAYSPATGLAYVNAVDQCVTVDLDASPQAYVAGKPWLGSSNSNGTLDTTRSGWLYAVNATTGSVAWRYHSTLPMLAGVTPTSGGLVFTADLLGNVLAFDATSGALLASVSTSLPTGGGVISYEVAGKQYVAVAAGMTGNFKTPSVNSEIVILGL
jgi:alcohol dehydrogenase (cytochrome c)